MYWYLAARALKINSCENVGLQKNFADRPESYDSNRAKNCIYCAQMLAGDSAFIFSFSNTIWLKESKHLSTDLIFLLTLKIF
jgi:hypothetical protein